MHLNDVDYSYKKPSVVKIEMDTLVQSGVKSDLKLENVQTINI